MEAILGRKGRRPGPMSASVVNKFSTLRRPTRRRNSHFPRFRPVAKPRAPPPSRRPAPPNGAQRADIPAPQLAASDWRLRGKNIGIGMPRFTNQVLTQGAILLGSEGRRNYSGFSASGGPPAATGPVDLALWIALDAANIMRRSVRLREPSPAPGNKSTHDQVLGLQLSVPCRRAHSPAGEAACRATRRRAHGGGHRVHPYAPGWPRGGCGRR